MVNLCRGANAGSVNWGIGNAHDDADTPIHTGAGEVESKRGNEKGTVVHAQEETGRSGYYFAPGTAEHRSMSHTDGRLVQLGLPRDLEPNTRTYYTLSIISLKDCIHSPGIHAVFTLVAEDAQW